MGLASVFKNVSSIAVSTFAKELGPCTFRKRLGTSSYDTESGTHTPDYDDFPVLTGFYDLDDKEVLDLSNRAEHQKALISGKDLSVVPGKGDMIVDQNDISFSVSRVTTDMYKALYIVYVKEVNES